MRRGASAAVAAAPPKRCAIYTRKSTTMGLEQEFNTLDAQREACEAYIRSQASAGWRILPGRYDDGGFTGANIDRPAFQRLLADVDSGRVDTIVVYKLDRISRSLLDFATVMSRLNKAGVGFVSVTQNFSTTDAVGRMTLNLLATFAEFEREQIGERTRDKIAASRRRGKWTGGFVPLGYRVLDKKLVVDGPEAELVREIFRLYLERRSALSVAQELRERGCKTKKHCTASGRVREPRAWGKNDVLGVLKNPLYAGLMRYRDELHDGEHEAIVDRQTFETVRGLLPDADRERAPRGRNPAYLLSGILMCGRCGSALTAASSQKGGQEYRYYRCVKRDKEGRSACSTRPLAGQAIENYVAEQLREATRNGEMAAAAAGAAERIDIRRRKCIAERTRVSRDIQNLVSHAKGTAAAVSAAGRHANSGSAAKVADQLQALECQLARIDGELADLEASRNEAVWIAQCLRDFDSVWDILLAPNRGRLLRAVVERVDVDDDVGELRLTLADFCGGETSEVTS